MPKLTPLQQWFCDKCGKIIESPNQGYLIWNDDRGDNKRSQHSFRIIHNKVCDDEDLMLSAALSRVIGPAGLPYLLSMVDMGPLHRPDDNLPEVRSLREWATLVRRLHVPFYEEARSYWAEAQQDGFFDGTNELSVYDPEDLELLIKKYEKRRERN